MRLQPGGVDLIRILQTKRLSRSEQIVLLMHARDAILARLEDREPPVLSEPGKRLRRRCGVFVTLFKGNKLRGCIGYIHSDKPLYQAVAELAEAAAFHDPRFQPLRKEELPEIHIEISVLSALKRISSPRQIKLNHHGILVRQEHTQGILLPQVATKHKWDRETFLEHACIKANLPKDAWKRPETHIYVFTAQIFEE